VFVLLREMQKMFGRGQVVARMRLYLFFVSLSFGSRVQGHKSCETWLSLARARHFGQGRDKE
jgi:hypothetical protein